VQYIGFFEWRSLVSSLEWYPLSELADPLLSPVLLDFFFFLFLNLVELAMYSFWGVSWLSDFTSVPP
jgi:hypothetical protein